VTLSKEVALLIPRTWRSATDCGMLENITSGDIEIEQICNYV
jgi:hypothetical protein